jgi:hypothetical protein
MNIYLLIYYAFLVFNIGYVAAKHNESKTDNYNIWVTLINSLLTLVLLWGIAGWKFV